ncbi:MAG: hypothetical protein ACKO2Y_10655 [Actinomycetota bacterium]
MTSDPQAPRAAAATARLVTVARLLGVVPAVLVGVLLAVFVSWWLGLLVLALLVGGWLAWVEHRRRTAVARTLAAIGPSLACDGTHPRWENVVDGLCTTTGVSGPELRVVDAPVANAAAVAHGGRVVLVVTSGLADDLTQIELEAVGANLLTRVRTGVAELATMAVGLPGPGPAASGFVTRTLVDGLGDQHAVRSDLDAAGLTRYPPGVARALRRLDAQGTEIPGALPVTAPLWLAPVVGADRVPPSVAATVMQPTGLRVAVVEEL